MATTNLNISVVEKRMMKISEAAHYTGCPASKFKHMCPVIPVLVTDGALRWDKRDLDSWLDSLKVNTFQADKHNILRRL